MPLLHRSTWNRLSGVGAVIVVVAAAGCGGAADAPAEPEDAEAAPAAVAPKTAKRAPVPENLERFSPETTEQFQAAVEAVDANPRSAERWRELGMIYQANFEYAHAATAYEEAVLLDPKDPRSWYYLSVVRNNLGDFDDAYAAIERASSLAPEFAPTHWRRAVWRLDEGELEIAMAAVDRSLELAPGDATARTIRARVLLQSGRADDAAEVLEKLVDERADDAYLHFLLGTAYRQSGRMDEAATELERGDGEEPVWSDPWLHEMASRLQGFFTEYKRARDLITAGRAQQAVGMLEALREDRPDEMMIQIELIRAYRVLGNHEAALLVLDRAAELDQGDARIPFQRAGVYRDLARTAPPDEKALLFEEALANADRALEISPDFALAHTMRSDLLMLLGRLDESIAGHRHARAINPGNGTVAFRLGAALCSAQRWAEAVEPLEAAHRLESDRSDIALLLAVALFRDGQIEEARRVTADGVERFPSEMRFGQLLQQIDAPPAPEDG